MDVGRRGFIRVPGYGTHLAATTDPGIHERQAQAPAGFADAVAGFLPLGEGQQPGWHVVFTVADRDDAAAAVESAGGTVLESAVDDGTRTAVIRDPSGATCTLSAPTVW